MEINFKRIVPILRFFDIAKAERVPAATLKKD
jgi:hypothetical protein